MTNETNEQKCDCTHTQACKECAESKDIDWDLIEPEKGDGLMRPATKQPQCEKCGFYNGRHDANCSPLPPQEVEAKEDDFILQWIKSTGRDYMHVSIEALRLLQELHDYHISRLRSSMGKVPSDQDIDQEIAKRGRDDTYFQNTPDYYSGFEIGAKWMRSEVAPVIAGLEEEKKHWEKEADDYCNDYVLQKQQNTILRSELKQAKEALIELSKEAEDLMDFCIDRRYLDNEDKTDGQILFDNALNKAKNLLTPKKD